MLSKENVIDRDRGRLRRSVKGNDRTQAPLLFLLLLLQTEKSYALL